MFASRDKAAAERDPEDAAGLRRDGDHVRQTAATARKMMLVWFHGD